MAVTLRTDKPDKLLKQIVKVLDRYAKAHPNARIEAYRQNNVSVRVRIIDKEFEGQSRTAREDGLWGYLKELPEETAAEISLALLLTPDESKKSFANVEFDDPIRSQL